MSTEAQTPVYAAPRRLAIIPLVAVVAGFLILMALGVWQVQRLQWKESLLARIAALQNAPPEPLGVVLNRLGGGGEVDFVRVQTPCATLQQTPTLHLYSILDGVMGDRLIAACPIAAGPYRTLLVDRGFVSAERLGEVRAGPSTSEPLVGVLRKAEAPNWLSLSNNAAGNDWHSRDIAAMAVALHAPAPAPVMLMLETPGPKGFGPRPAAIPTDIPNNHLGYALTWFGLGIGLVVFYLASLRRPRAGRRRS